MKLLQELLSLHDAKIIGENIDPDLKSYLDKHNGEITPEMERAGFTPVKITHDYLDPNLLDPSEWDDWDSPSTASSFDKINDLALDMKRSAKVPPILVQGLPTGRFMPQVMDGHHRTAAAIKAGVKIPVTFTLNTMIGIWKKAHKDPRSVRELRNEYLQSFK